MPNIPPRSISMRVEEGDALSFGADVLAVKYAQEHFGLDRAVAGCLSRVYPNLSDLMPQVNRSKLLRTQGTLQSAAVLFIGVKPITEFGYSEIRDFGRDVLVCLAEVARDTRHLALTIHGTGYGLDETEVFKAEIAGLIDAVVSGDFPPGLSRVTVVERNPGRASRLRAVLEQLIPGGLISSDASERVQAIGRTVDASVRSAGYASSSKPLIFVAMPYTESMDDIFHYGIQNAVNGAGCLCERADQSHFTGDVLEWVKKRISSASLMIADLSGANPNVYLEVGYAWGCGRPTVLIANDPAELKFDLKGQRCLIYHNIRMLENLLRTELASLGIGSNYTANV